MAFASVRKSRAPQDEIKVNEFLQNKNKSIGKVYLYMGIGLAISAIVSIVVGALFAGWFTNFGRIDWAGEVPDTAIFTYVGVLIASYIIMFIDSLVITHRAYSDKKSLWVPYILYTILMGVFLSSFLIAGIDFYTLGEAFGISGLVFVIMGLIGYYSKSNLNVLGMIAAGALLCLLLGGAFWFVLWLINPAAFYIYNVIVSIAVMAFLLILVAVDTYNIKNILQNSAGKNMPLYCAFKMYTDFIAIFVRILYFLALIKGNNRK